MMKLSHFALTTAVVGGLTIATAGELLAASVPSNTVAIRQAVPAGVTDVRCGEFVGACGPYWGYSRGYQAYPGYGWVTQATIGGTSPIPTAVTQHTRSGATVTGNFIHGWGGAA
jgi:hypothetical protein